MKNFSVNAVKIFGNGAFPENFLTRKLGEISVLNAAQELLFSKFTSLQTATALEKELHSFFHCFSAVVERTLSTSRLLLLKHVIAINVVM